MVVLRNSTNSPRIPPRRTSSYTKRENDLASLDKNSAAPPPPPQRGTKRALSLDRMIRAAVASRRAGQRRPNQDTKKKSVTFGTQLQFLPQPPSPADDNNDNVSVSDLWYTEDDFDTFKSHFFQQAAAQHRRQQRSCKEEENVLVAVYERCLHGENVLEPHLEQALQDHYRCSKKNDNDNNDNNKVALGMERLEAMLIFRDKKLRRSLLYAVLNNQQKQQQSSSSKGRHSKQTVRAEALRMACLEVTQVSTLFAHHIAVAAASCAAACGNEEE